MTKLGPRLADLRHQRGLSASSLSKRAGLSMNYVRNVERGITQPRPESLRAICRALDLPDKDASALLRLASLELFQPADLALTLWQHLPAQLLHHVPHPDFALFDVTADDLVADGTRALGSLLAWLALCDGEPTRPQAARMRAVSRRVFETSLKLPDRVPVLGPSISDGAACDAASSLPRAWRNELFARRETTARLASMLREWAYFPRGFRSVAQVGARLKDVRLDPIYSFDSATVDQLINIHDAMIAHRLWTELDLFTAFGADYQSAQEYDLACQFRGSAGDLSVLLSTRAEHLWPIALDSGREERRAAYIAAAERTKLALRLFELPELAARLLRDPNADRALPRDEIKAALRHADDLVDPTSRRFAGSPPQLSKPTSADSVPPS